MAYYVEPQKQAKSVIFIIKSKTGNVIFAEVHVHSEYKFSNTGATDPATGQVQFDFNTFDEDNIMVLLIEYTNEATNSLVTVEKTGPYPIASSMPYTIIVN